jgi:hypothetical protein
VGTEFQLPIATQQSTGQGLHLLVASILGFWTPVWVGIVRLGSLQRHSYSKRVAAEVRSSLVDC